MPLLEFYSGSLLFVNNFIPENIFVFENTIGFNCNEMSQHNRRAIPYWTYST